METQRPTVDLITLLPSSPYVLSYSLPLLLLSILLTFAGTFLTLHRTRSFAPLYDTIPPTFDTHRRKKLSWFLEGGVGGVVSGYTFGVHLSTFLALLIPNTSKSPPLSPKSFIPIWLLSALITACLAGRWKYCALAFAGLSGGATMSLSLSIISHPSLLTRVVFTAILMPILTVLVLLPLARVQYIALRVATASTGAFGIVLSIALLAYVPAWGNVWERLWLANKLTWGTSKERGLSAAWCIFFCLGIVCEWFLKRTYGENPDQKWDHYLADYAANLPNAADRAGFFQPRSFSLWGRLFGRQKPPAPLTNSTAFPPDEDPKLSSETQVSRDKFQRGDVLTKGRSSSQARLKMHAKSERRREGVKFRPLDDSSGSDSDDFKSPVTPDSVRPWLKTRPSLNSMGSGSVTLNGNEEVGSSGKVDGKIEPEKERIKLGRIKAGLGKHGRGANSGGEVIPEYSDYEEDVTAHAQRVKRRVSRDKPGWSPEFLQRTGSGKTASGSGSNRTSRQSVPLPGSVSVPATPSLIKAIDRINAAQQEAYGKPATTNPEPLGKPESVPSTSSKADPEAWPKVAEVEEEKKVRGARWEEFWREVKDKAKQ